MHSLPGKRQRIIRADTKSGGEGDFTPLLAIFKVIREIGSIGSNPMAEKGPNTKKEGGNVAHGNSPAASILCKFGTTARDDLRIFAAPTEIIRFSAWEGLGASQHDWVEPVEPVSAC